MQFSRTVAPDTSKGPALLAFMQHSKWRKIAILASAESLHFETRHSLAKQLAAAGMKVLKPAAFEPGNFKDAVLSEIRRSGIRIVAVLAYDADAQTVASRANKEGMAQAGWAWLLTDDRLVSTMAGGWLWFRTFLASDMQAFAKQVSDYTKSHFNISVFPDSVDLPYSAALYDAVMLYAHAATKVLTQGGDLHDGQAVTEAVRSTRFEGVGNSVVSLDKHGDRIQSYEMMNYILKEGNVLDGDDVMSSVAVGMFNSTQEQYSAYERQVVWPGKTLEVPADYFSGAC